MDHRHHHHHHHHRQLLFPTINDCHLFTNPASTTSLPSSLATHPRQHPRRFATTTTITTPTTSSTTSTKSSRVRRRLRPCHATYADRTPFWITSSTSSSSSSSSSSSTLNSIIVFVISFVAVSLTASSSLFVSGQDEDYGRWGPPGRGPTHLLLHDLPPGPPLPDDFANRAAGLDFFGDVGGPGEF